MRSQSLSTVRRCDGPPPRVYPRTVIAAILLLHERSVDESVAQLRAGELEQVIKLVGRCPSCYPPGTLDARKDRRQAPSPEPVAPAHPTGRRRQHARVGIVARPASAQLIANDQGALNHRPHLRERDITRQVFKTAVWRDDDPACIDMRQRAPNSVSHDRRRFHGHV
jgi:hypothetical protein